MDAAAVPAFVVVGSRDTVEIIRAREIGRDPAVDPSGRFAVPDSATTVVGRDAAALGPPRGERKAMAQLLMKLWKDEQAPTAVEYAILAGLIAVVIVAAVGGIGTTLRGMFERVPALPGG